MIRILTAALLASCLFAVAPQLAQAHKPSDSYLTLSADEDRFEGRWDIALRDLDFAIGLDGNGDGEIQWGEVRQRHDAIAAYALSRLNVASDGAACALAPGEQLIEDHSDGAYTVLPFRVDCPKASNQVAVSYRLFFDLDPSHRGLLQVVGTNGVNTAVLAPDRPRYNWDLGRNNVMRAFFDYLGEGLWHIWIGFDHILFLVTLLLPAVLRREAEQWRTVTNLWESARMVVKVVTAFTVAHSITLSAATLGYAELPSRLVETVIAASVIVAALNNLFPVVQRRLWALAFLFGLLHGFGFAAVLSDLGLSSGALLISLLAFNLGVELGQLAIVAALLPAIYLMRRTWVYPRVLLPFGSASIAVLGSLWLAERSLGLSVF